MLRHDPIIILLFVSSHAILSSSIDVMKIHLNSLGNYLAKSWIPESGSCLECFESRRLDIKNSITYNHARQDVDYPLILMSIFILHPTPFMSEFFDTIHSLNYPKEKISILIHNSDVQQSYTPSKTSSSHHLSLKSNVTKSPSKKEEKGDYEILSDNGIKIGIHEEKENHDNIKFHSSEVKDFMSSQKSMEYASIRINPSLKSHPADDDDDDADQNESKYPKNKVHKKKTHPLETHAADDVTMDSFERSSRTFSL